ncbi:hypothetical protein [Georgenia sp. AZ-5]|uniref:hypothetical protein n=1 Tax=Georgenia sp. AZ-5 TaxID=3367526 RepID=UPI003753ED32
MADYDRPVPSADEAAEALRALAHATRWFETPGDTYWVVGDLLAITRRLQAVLGNVASAHMHHRELAHDDAGDRQEGHRHARDAAAALRRASLRLEEVERLINMASVSTGRIAWYDPPHAKVETEPPRPTAPPQQKDAATQRDRRVTPPPGLSR